MPTFSWPRLRSYVLPLAVVFGLVGLLLGGCAPNITDASIKDMPLGEVRSLIRKQAESKSADVVVLIDARSPRAFEAERIPDARNLSLADFPDRLDRRNDLDRRITRFGYKIVYGDNPGSAAAQALVKRMLGLGYEDVVMFRGGLEEWKRAGLPVAGSGAATAGGDAAPRAGPP